MKMVLNFRDGRHLHSFSTVYFKKQNMGVISDDIMAVTFSPIYGSVPYFLTTPPIYELQCDGPLQCVILDATLEDIRAMYNIWVNK